MRNIPFILLTLVPVTYVQQKNEGKTISYALHSLVSTLTNITLLGKII